MKAIVCTKLGEPNLLEIKEIDKPSITEEDVLIKVEAAGVNFPDALLVQGKYQIVLDPPFTPGNEVCGVVEDKGANVELPIGSKVIGLPPVGGFAEYVALNKNLVIPVNSDFDPLAGASLPINYGTTYYALKRRAKANNGETLLVLGASGGIGTASIQLAQVMGLKTICAVGSDDKEEYVFGFNMIFDLPSKISVMFDLGQVFYDISINGQRNNVLNSGLQIGINF